VSADERTTEADFGSGEVRAVLARLLWAWTEQRHPRIADLVDRVAARALADQPREELEASGRELALEAWRTIETAGDPLDFDRLGAALRGGSQHEVTAKVRALAARTDPRLGAALLALLAKPPFAGLQSRPMLEAILAALEETRDPRLVEPIRGLAGRYLGIVRSGTGSWMVGRLGAVATALAALPAPELPATLAATLDALEARFGRPVVDAAAVAGKRTLAELLALVYAAPDDDGPRIVYADALLEQRDARGELIALQIADARGALDVDGKARLAAILADHARIVVWAQPLSTAATCRFERGFPAAIALRKNAKVLLGEPAWATIVEIQHLGNVTQPVAHELLDQPAARHVRTVSSVASRLLRKFGPTPRPRTAVTVHYSESPAATDFAACPALTKLIVRTAYRPARDAFAALALRELELDFPECRGGELDLPRTLEALALRCAILPSVDLQAPARLTRLELVGRVGELALPATLESLAVTGLDAPPADLHALSRLAELRIRFREPIASLVLPPSLRTLEYRAANERWIGRLPALDLGGARIERANLAAAEVEAGDLAPLRPLRELELFVDRLAPGALDELVALRRLRLSAGAVPASFAHLAELRDLDLMRAARPPELAGLPIERLVWPLSPSAIPDGLPLRELEIKNPRSVMSADDLLRLLVRFPDLRTVKFRDTTAGSEAGPWPALVRALEASRVSRFEIGDYRGFVLARDDDGELAWLAASMFTPTIETIALALRRLTRLDCPHRVPPRVAARLTPSALRERP
jgi:uncharacterized protein (TIGR02996 family)